MIRTMLCAGCGALAIVLTGCAGGATHAGSARTAAVGHAIAEPRSAHHAAPVASTAATTRVLKLKVVQDPHALHVTDVGRKGPSAGDTYVYSATLRAGGRVVGRLEGTTVAADPRYQGDVSTQYYVLHDGTVAVVGGGQSGAPGVGRPDNQIYDAIVGGTGAYVGARGWVSVRDVNDTTEILTMHFG